MSAWLQHPSDPGFTYLARPLTPDALTMAAENERRLLAGKPPIQIGAAGVPDGMLEVKLGWLQGILHRNGLHASTSMFQNMQPFGKYRSQVRIELRLDPALVLHLAISQLCQSG